MNTIFKLIQKLRDPDYRKSFVQSQIGVGIPFQLRGLMKARGWKQDDLVRRTGMLQPRVSAMLKPGKTKFTLETLRRLAEAFDVGLMVKFVPFSELAYWSDSFNPDRFNVPQFAEDPGIISEEARLAETIAVANAVEGPAAVSGRPCDVASLKLFPGDQ